VTRPTSARARESIFSRLQVRLDFEGARVLDIFAGSGSLGCEALSRGAGRVTFVDSSRAAVGSIEKNLRAMEMAERGRILALDVFRALQGLASEGAEFDLVFVDAPHRNDLSHQVLQSLSRLGLAAAEAWIVVGQSKRAPSAPEAPQGLTRQSIVTIGDHRIAFYRRPPEAASSGS
jgi:16S rRNA (guanine(966)-N(2))-methyltransferase RsmD